MNNKPSNSKDSIDKYLSEEYVNAVSSTDCTGLIPANPESEAALESYKEIYNFEVPIIEENSKTNQSNKLK